MTSPEITTCLWFDTEAEEAARFYCTLFDEARITNITRALGVPDPAPAFLVAFELMGQRYTLMNGGPSRKLTEAASIQVMVETQAEVDRLWNALSEGGAPIRCGWVTDRYGLSWQIIPFALPRLVAAGGARAGRVITAMMGMGKIDIAVLEAAGA